jgi:hypothetical protein
MALIFLDEAKVSKMKVAATSAQICAPPLSGLGHTYSPEDHGHWVDEPLVFLIF